MSLRCLLQISPPLRSDQHKRSRQVDSRIKSLSSCSKKEHCPAALSTSGAPVTGWVSARSVECRHSRVDSERISGGAYKLSPCIGWPSADICKRS